MRMWSRGLGRQNLGINLLDTKLMTLDEALDYMMSEAKGPMLREIKSENVICLSGKILPPTGWEFVIVLEIKDIFIVAWKLTSWKTLKSILRNSFKRLSGIFKRSSLNNTSQSQIEN
ncbi:hypothetical protein PITCH_A610002 [uncultured Desulfobacterium sp.]|uniref:Uncharacterized protein n=1 Tax=uncultured Desulfobacterium sp. TaxID=201089 RepID=A0A445N133_9BACT|nr:hypothetical protein PITCH_A610002 [uncultured Desulfobacterium sp.]